MYILLPCDAVACHSSVPGFGLHTFFLPEFHFNHLIFANPLNGEHITGTLAYGFGALRIVIHVTKQCIPVGLKKRPIILDMHIILPLP